MNVCLLFIYLILRERGSYFLQILSKRIFVHVAHQSSKRLIYFKAIMLLLIMIVWSNATYKINYYETFINIQ